MSIASVGTRPTAAALIGMPCVMASRHATLFARSASLNSSKAGVSRLLKRDEVSTVVRVVGIKVGSDIALRASLLVELQSSIPLT